MTAARTGPLSFAPGTDYQYSNVGYTLAGLIVLQLDTGTFDEIVQRRLFRSLGLEHTGFEPNRVEDISQRLAPLTVNLGPWGLSTATWLGIEESSPAWTGSAGGGFSTPAEYSRLAAALLSGSALTDASRVRLLTPRARFKGADGPLDYALGVGVVTLEDPTELRHGGALEPHGFSTYMTHIPEWDLTLVVMSNRGLGVYEAKAVNNTLLSLITSGTYTSPFPDDAGSWWGASEIGVIHLLLMPLLFLSLIVTALRQTRTGRAGLAVSVVTRASVLLFFRGLLAIHTGDSQVLVLSAALISPVLLVLGFWLKKQPEMPRLPPARA